MKPQRFAFRVDRLDSEAVVAMHCGEGVARARRMPLICLKQMRDACRQVRDGVIAVMEKNKAKRARLPEYPGYRRLGGGGNGTFTVRVGAWREDGQVAYGTSFHDADEDTGPVLLLVNEQLQQFIDQVDGLIPEGAAGAQGKPRERSGRRGRVRRQPRAGSRPRRPRGKKRTRYA